MNFDSNSLYRHPEIVELRDEDEEDPMGRRGGRLRHEKPLMEAISKLPASPQLSEALLQYSPYRPPGHIPRISREKKRSLVALPPVRVDHPHPHAPVYPNHPIDRPLKFFIVEERGSQHKVMMGDNLMINYLRGTVIGQRVTFDRVMLIATANYTIIGRPYIPDAAVKVTVEEHNKTPKVLIFKKKRRKGYKRMKSFQHPVTILAVDECVEPEYVHNAPTEGAQIVDIHQSFAPAQTAAPAAATG